MLQGSELGCFHSSSPETVTYSYSYFHRGTHSSPSLDIRGVQVCPGIFQLRLPSRLGWGGGEGASLAHFCKWVNAVIWQLVPK